MITTNRVVPRASPLPKIGEDDVDFGRISTKGLRKRRITPDSKNVDGYREWCRVRPCAARRIIREGRYTRQAHTTGQHDMF